MIIVDDADLKNKSETELLAIFERENSTSVRILYKTVNLKNIRLILTVNKLNQILSSMALASTQILRRLTIVRIPQKITFNIINNTYNNCFFNTEAIQKNKQHFSEELEFKKSNSLNTVINDKYNEFTFNNNVFYDSEGNPTSFIPENIGGYKND